jgi:flagellar basal body-associated protein FliL
MADNSVEIANEKGGSKILTVLTLLHILATAALFYFVVTARQDLDKFKVDLAEKKAEQTELAENSVKLTAEEEDGKTMGPLVDLGSIRVNLRGSDGRDHRLMTTLSLEVDSEETRREAESKIVPIRFSLHKLLSSRRPEEVIGSEQMELVRKSMRRNADAMLASKKGKVLNVWPNDWIVE